MRWKFTPKKMTNLFAQKVGEAENPSKSRYVLKLKTMKKLKVILPMLGIIFAIGLTFASVSPKSDPNVQAQDYVLVDGNWQAIPEQACTGGNETCRVQFGEEGPIYDLYDEMDVNTRKDDSVDGEPILIQP
ncbi:secreted protein [Zunongwangia profunda SM-A87]|uniref:Secreted protein n=2 Tax=Zunongwangia profunda TaxID=398743 RepID=D5BJR4_ZUNPS|nr:secreted protein [Zunongwangia profunda SM-A87]